MKSTDEQQLDELENAAFELEVDYQVDNLYTKEEYELRREWYEMRINHLLVKIYGMEWLDTPDDSDGLYRIKEEYFLHSYYNKKERNKND